MVAVLLSCMLFPSIEIINNAEFNASGSIKVVFAVLKLFSVGTAAQVYNQFLLQNFFLHNHKGKIKLFPVKKNLDSEAQDMANLGK